MKIIVDKDGRQAIEYYVDLDLKTRGIKALQDSNYILSMLENYNDSNNSNHDANNRVKSNGNESADQG